MPFITAPIGAPGDGVNPTEVKSIVVQNRSGTTRVAGEVVCLAMAGTVGGAQMTYVDPSTGTTTNVSVFPGRNAGQSIFNSAINVSDASYVVPSPFPVCVIQDTSTTGAAANPQTNPGKNMKVAFEGILKVKCQGSVTPGTKLAVDTTNLCLKAAAVGDNRVVGICLGTVTTGITDVLFNGWTGFTGITIT
jgi:hypothetical protein